MGSLSRLMRSIVLILTILALAAVGCGSDDDNDASAPTTGSAETQATTPETQAEEEPKTQTESESEAIDPETGDYADPEERAPKGPTTAQFTKRANSICRRGRTRMRAAQKKVTQGGAGPAAVGGLLAAQAAVGRGTTTSLAKLKVPEGGETEVKELLRVRRLVEKYRSEAAEVLTAGGTQKAAQPLGRAVRAQKKAARLATAIGLETCAQA